MTVTSPSTPSASTERLLADLLERATREIKAGMPLDLDALVAEFPDQAEQLRQLLSAVQLLADLSRSVETNGSMPLGIDGPPTEPLGDFQIVREIGRGGMGIVYEAVQLSLNRNVALKVLPFAATMDPRHLQRFRNEAQAAACLHHPNIVPVHGVGCDRGVHYYAMQLIEGQTLAEVIGRSRPLDGTRDRPSPPAPLPQSRERGEETSPSERVHEAARDAKVLPSPPASGGEGMGARGDDARPAASPPFRNPQSEIRNPTAVALTTKTDKTRFRHIATLIASAADALEYAHSMGVVHRDIKPGNLMLDFSPLPPSGRGAGGEGHLWITDFGLAKLASPAASLRREPGELTLTGDLIGTLRYMSPEQALAKHGLVDHRTDIYSLGATLYELLTLKPAVAGNDKAEILKSIAWEEPTPPRKHDKSIPAELETITLKCLAKEPGDRYATAGDVAEDLRRWLGDRAIKAKAPGWREKARGWYRRNQVVAMTVMLSLLLTLCVGLVTMTWGLRRAHEEEAKAIKESNEKETAQRIAVEKVAVANAIRSFLEDDLLGQADIGNQPVAVDGEKGRNPNITVRELLDRAAANIPSKFANQPDVEACIRLTIGRAYLKLGNYELAEKQFDRSSELFTAHIGPDHEETIVANNNLSTACLKQFKLDKAEAVIRDALRASPPSPTEGTRAALINKGNLGMLYLKKGQLQKARATLEDVITLSAVALGSDDSNTLVAKRNLASLLRHLGENDEAEKLFREALDKMSLKLGKDHPNTLHSQSDLGCFYFMNGEMSKAEPLLEQALLGQTRMLGAEHEDTLVTKSALAKLFAERSDFARAELCFQEVIRDGSARLGVKHPTILRVRFDLAKLFEATGQFSKAEPLLLEVLQSQTEQLGATHHNTLVFKHDVGCHYLLSGNFDKAKQILNDVLQSATSLNPTDETIATAAKNSLAIVYLRLDERDIAEKLLREVLNYQIRKLGPTHPDTLTAKYNLGALYLTTTQFALAEPLLGEVVEQSALNLGADHPKVLELKSSLAQLYLQWQRFEEAESVLRNVVAGWQGRAGTDSRAYEEQVAKLGFVLMQLKKHAEAEPVIRALIAIREKTGSSNWTVFNARFSLGAAILGQGRLAEAEPLLLESYAGLVGRKASIPVDAIQRIADSVSRVVQLYEEHRQDDKADRWRKELAAWHAAKPTNRPPPVSKN